MKTLLILKFSFQASHSLSDFEVPHSHLWNLEVAVSGEPIEGRVIDMVCFRTRIDLLVHEIRGQYLNEFKRVDAGVREYPTCETLSQFFWHEIAKILQIQFIPENKSLSLHTVSVGICDASNTEIGAVRLSA